MLDRYIILLNTACVHAPRASFRQLVFFNRTLDRKRSMISNVFREVNCSKQHLNCREYFPFISSNFAILSELCDLWWIMQRVAMWGQLCEIATLQNIRSPVRLYYAVISTVIKIDNYTVHVRLCRMQQAYYINCFV